MKVRSINHQQKASRVFTDREEPRNAFWKHYHQASMEAADDCNIHVLTYYGIGGIGKTRLLKKLMEEMDSRLSGKNHVYLDFSLYQESRTVLASLKNKLVDEFGFSFPLFELGSYIYAKKTGASPDSIEIKRLTEKSPFLNLLMDVMGKIPAISVAAQVLSFADQLSAYLGTYLKKHSREIRQIEYLEAEELYRCLPYFFALDMAQNQERRKSLLVIFLDTYERLVNELSSVGEPLNNDLWLRGDQGLVQNIPQVLWVIAGREKLKWEKFNPEWNEALDQHILGSLSFADSDNFLKSAGIGNPALRKALYDLTNGTPVYLDLCVDQFERLNVKGIEPDITLFGEDTYHLIERFIRYMSDSQKDLVYLLSFLQRWNDDLLIELADSLLPNFSLTTYEKAMNLSFICESSDGFYFIHQTVGEVVVAHCPALLKKKLAEHIISAFSAKLTKLHALSEEYPIYLTYIMRAGLICYEEPAELRAFVIQDVLKFWDNFFNTYQFNHMTLLLDMLMDKAQRHPDNALYALALSLKAEQMLFTYENSAESARLADHAFSLALNTLGRDHPDTLRIANTLAMIYYHLEASDKAQMLVQYIYDKHLELYGEKHPDTIASLSNLGLIHQRFGRHHEALEIANSALVIQRELHGEDSIEVLRSMNHLSSALMNCGRLQDALDLQNEIVHRYTLKLTEKHPETIYCICKLGNIYSIMKDYMQAAEQYQRAMHLYKNSLGADDPHTYLMADNVATALAHAGRLDIAIPLQEELMSSSMECFGENHETARQIMHNLSVSYKRAGNTEKADELKRKLRLLSDRT